MPSNGEFLMYKGTNVMFTDYVMWMWSYTMLAAGYMV